MPITLVECSRDAPCGLDEFLRDLGQGELGFGGTPVADGSQSLQDYLEQRVEWSLGVGLPDDRVPETTFWALDHEQRVVGMVKMRHRLNEMLELHGGHIGYYVKSDCRGRGYATEMLRQALIHLRRYETNRALITVRPDNSGSIHVIETNGGQRTDDSIDPQTGMHLRRYLIELE